MRKGFVLCFLFLLGSTYFRGYGWGKKGHEVVVLVAKQWLHPAARERVKAILAPYSLLTEAFYPDKIRYQPRYRFTSTWHYASMDTFSMATYESLQGAHPQENIVWAIEHITQALKQGQFPSGMNERLYLALLLHLVADVHQPFHVGRAADEGGNLRQVRCCTSGMLRTQSLHALWDTTLLDALPSSEVLAKEIVDALAPHEVVAWQAAPLMEWVRESVACREAAYEVPFDEFTAARYVARHLPTVKKRLAQAGVRLAAVLNGLYGT